MKQSFEVTVWECDDTHGDVQVIATVNVSGGSPATLEYPGDDPEVEIEDVHCYAEDDDGFEYEIVDYPYDEIAIEEEAMEKDSEYSRDDGDDWRDE